MHELPRRTVLWRALQIATAWVVMPRIVRAATAAHSCVDPQAESLRASLHYAGVSAVADQTCSGCAFFTRAGNQPACGSCAIMSGPVDETGRCDSWSARN